MTGHTMPDFLTFAKKQEKFFPAGVFVLTICLYLPQLFLREALLRDVACRYAPMAEAFAAGQFRYAFHPRVLSLSPLVSGCFCYLTGCSGFTAVQLSSLLFLGLSVFPLYRILKLVFDRSTAVWGTLLLVLVSPVTSVCVSGLRESHKLFVLLVLSLGILSVFKERSKYSGFLLAGAGCGLALCTRVDLILPSFALMIAAGAMEFAALKSLKRSFCGLLLVLPFLLFEIAVNYYVSGFAIPGSHYIRFFQLLPQEAATPGGVWIYVILPSIVNCFLLSLICGGILRSRIGRKLPRLVIPLLAAAAVISTLLLLFNCTGLSFSDRIKALFNFLHSILYGCNLPLSILAALGIFSLKKQNKWDDSQTFLLDLFFFWILAVILQILVIEHNLYVSKRYLLPCTLLLAGWGVRGIALCGNKLKEKTGRAGKVLSGVLFILLPCICLYHAYSNILEYKFDSRKKTQLETLKTVSAVIRKHYDGPRYFEPGFSFWEYRGCRRPKVAFIRLSKAVPAAYLSGGSAVPHWETPDFTVAPAEEKLSETKWRKIKADLPFGKTKINVWELKKTK